MMYFSKAVSFEYASEHGEIGLSQRHAKKPLRVLLSISASWSEISRDVM